MRIAPPGKQPFLVVGTAGSVDTGAFDRLDALAGVCAEHGLWLHVDGAFGALAAASPAHAHLVRGIERANSLAFDAHKWLHAPYGVGCVLFRDERAHRNAFTSDPAYLARSSRGTGCRSAMVRRLRAGAVARVSGAQGVVHVAAFRDRAVGCIDRPEPASLSTALGEHVAADADFELLAPVTLNVVCFRYRVPGLDDAELDRLNAEIAIDVQESGAAVVSTTRIAGRNALRACIINHRTREEDLAILLAAVRTAGLRRAGAVSSLV